MRKLLIPTLLGGFFLCLSNPLQAQVPGVDNTINYSPSPSNPNGPPPDPNAHMSTNNTNGGGSSASWNSAHNINPTLLNQALDELAVTLGITPGEARRMYMENRAQVTIVAGGGFVYLNVVVGGNVMVQIIIDNN